MSMFCYQCQEAAGGKGCTVRGVCGKQDTTAKTQDMLIYILKGVSQLVTQAKAQGVSYDFSKVDDVVLDGLFTTITNANFDDAAILKKVKETIVLRDELKKALEAKGAKFTNLHDSATWNPSSDAEIAAKSEKVGVLLTENEDVRSLRELITYGLKGAAAYTQHAYHLGFRSDDVPEFIEKALAALLDDTLDANALVALTMETGKFGVNAMALLDKANTTRFGNPEITEVNIGVRNNPGILVSGHDLNDIEQLLQQTEGTGVDVYTHSEMLPTHYYPKLKKYSNLAGNYGSSWWKQGEDFTNFNGPILFTTNCIVPPKADATYKDRVFTTGSAGFTGWKHITPDANGKKDFSEIIEAAKKCKPPVEIETGKIVGGFAHAQVFAVADKVVEAVKSGAIKKFFVMAGCDGRMKSRDYYTEFAEKLPKDTVILTAGCAKYRYNKLNLGDIGGIPRVLDAGQCNDSYSLAVIALKLKEVFALNDINELPIAYNIAWYEQKAVIVLLALLYLGVKNIHLGPTLPAFLSPNVAKVLVETFGIGGVGTVDDDLKMFLGA